jgi:hypothetical protein
MRFKATIFQTASRFCGVEVEAETLKEAREKLWAFAADREPDGIHFLDEDPDKDPLKTLDDLFDCGPVPEGDWHTEGTEVKNVMRK